MRKKILITALFYTLCIQVYAQYSNNAMPKSYSTVSEFAENQRMWAETNMITYRKNIDELCSGRVNTVVGNELAHRLNKYHPEIPDNNSTYDLDMYLEWLKEAFQSGLKVSMSNFKQIEAGKIVLANSKQEEYKNKMKYFLCDVSVSGIENFKSQDVIYVYDDKQIAKLDKYELDSKGKVKIDLSDFMDDLETFGATYNYSQHWPVGVSINYYNGDAWMGVSFDFGINFDKDNVLKHELELTDIMNYKKIDYVYDSKWYATISPQFYGKYFSLGCGAGVICLSEHKTEYNYTTKQQTTNNSSYTSKSSSSNNTDTQIYRFMIRPTIKGFIPIADGKWYITVSGAYNYAFGFKEKNGFDFGIGLQYNFAYW